MSRKPKHSDHKDLLALLLNSIQGYAIFMLDTTGHVVSWNEGAERIKGYSAGEIIGKHFSIFYPTEVRFSGQPGHALVAALRDGNYQEEGWRLRKDGSAFWASAVITPIFEEQNLIGFAKVTRDLTERLLAEKQKGEHRTLVARMQEQEDLVATLTHDLKNPLIGANRLLELMQDHRLDKSTLQNHECLELLKNSIEDALALTRNLIDVFQPESNERALSIENVDLKALIAQAINAHKPTALMRATRISAQLPSGELIVPLDFDAMKRVLQNLLSNAVKFAPLNGKVDVRVTNGSSKITIEIEDDGPGIDESERGKLFQRFSQAALGKRHSGGSGLGLYTCKRLIESQNGSIDCVNSNKGALFRIQIPLTAQATSSTS